MELKFIVILDAETKRKFNPKTTQSQVKAKDNV
jgi:hypothetical protein